MVSVIVPVYNVEPYVDKCLESIVHQTYKDLEILVMEGKSTDQSLHICQKWETLDKRVAVFSEKDQGLSDARNKGIRRAAGEYVMFVDSDDWLDYECIEKMLHQAEEKKADLVCCNYNSCHFGTHEISQKRMNIRPGLLECQEDKDLYLCCGFPMAWGKLYKKALWTEHNLVIPLTRHEDCAVFPSLVYLSKRIVYCDEALYYYLEFRNDSLVNVPENRAQMPAAIRYAMDDLKRRSQFHHHYAALMIYARKFILGSLYEAEKVLEKGYFKQEIETPHLEFLNAYFPGWEKRSDTYLVTALGSFSLRWIIHEMIEGVKRLNPHFCFSGMIAQSVTGDEELHLNNPILLREQAVNEDLHGGLQKCLEIRHGKNEMLFLDFLEDDCNILILKDGNRCTKSSALLEEETKKLKVTEEIYYDSDRYWELWESSCMGLAEKIKQSYLAENVFLVKTRISYFYESGGKKVPYEQRNRLEKENENIRRKETFLLGCLTGIHIVEIPEDGFYTEETFKYGTQPIYSNNRLYLEIGNRLKLLLRERELHEEYHNTNSRK